MLIRPGLRRIVAPLGERFVAMYLLEGSERALLFDTGITASVEETLLPHLAEIGFDLARLHWVISSHCDFDHTGGNAAIVAAAPHVELLAGELDVPLTEDLEVLIEQRYGEFRHSDGFDDPPETTAYIREAAAVAPVTRALRGGEEFDLGDRVIRVLHTPGHSDGHLALWDERNAALIIGDATLGTTVPTASGDPAFPPTYRDTDPYLATIELFRGYDAELLLTAHYPVYEDAEVGRFLDASAEYIATIDAAITDALEPEGMTTLELIHRVAARLGPWGPAAAEYLIFPMTGNLERMTARGTVCVGTRDGLRTWARA
ncbi:MBL fold metallo-hydrolase [Galbitalea soli]|uniref:MBL fold metallo-hydrolase n=1 Tax=Galbitalea soli TaxID=1268042 RepID=A0A7C9TQI7_9MICO|nr:MBL fold metallo-hydrolase [Galbitalea soli]NEM91039.1 MBL fold metallo-hydrolase [Galbitalea soli]NYJ29727.1 glyoxylase-like metal-dependent hydrolase (beta-lactamase superfamily II) [Galbitalea soli]